ncbi:MAG TPA: dicarboxylate/amino acid:cation symporter [Chthoniobacterales bacterium]
MKESTQVLLGLGLGLAGGIAIAATHNPSLLHAADAIAPVGTLWVNAIRMTVIPLVVSLVITGVASASDVKAVGRLGGRTLAVFIAMLAAATLIMIPLAIALFAWLPHLIAVRPSLPPGATEAAQSLTSGAPSVGFASWLTSLIPTNPVNAAANGAMLPLILFTLLFALAIGKSPALARTTLLGFFSAVTETMLVLVRWVVRLAPIGIFGLMLPLGAHGGVGLAGAVGFYVIAYSAASVLFVLLLYPALAFVARVPMRVFARAALPAQLIAFSSSSSIASLPALVEGAEEKLKLPTEVTGFVLPLAVSMFKFAGPVAWPLGSLFVAWFYGVELHTPQYLTIAFAAIFLGFAAPGVPRGAFLMLAPLFVAIGLPLEGIGILIAVDAIPDLFATVTNATGDLAATAVVARFSQSTHALTVPTAIAPRKELKF